jgi:hypothetical protein
MYFSQFLFHSQKHIMMFTQLQWSKISLHINFKQFKYLSNFFLFSPRFHEFAICLQFAPPKQM